MLCRMLSIIPGLTHGCQEHPPSSNHQKASPGIAKGSGRGRGGGLTTQFKTTVPGI